MEITIEESAQECMDNLLMDKIQTLLIQEI